MRKYGYLLLCSGLAWVLNGFLLQINTLWTDIVCFALAACWLITVFYQKKENKQISLNLLLIFSFILAYIFVLKLPYDFGMHDLGGYAIDSDGHLGYITWITENLRLPDTHPLVDGQSIYVHPPLFHILEALFFRINRLIGFNWWQSFELGQLINMTFSVACTFITCDLLAKLNISEKGMQLAAKFLMFQPIILILGSVLNNDILSVFCLLLCLLFTVYWIKEQTMRSILTLALSLGAGMATKLSSALIIPCVALVFIVTFFQNISCWKKYTVQFSLFLLVSVPLATAWPLYQLIAHDLPLNFVRIPVKELSVADHSLWERFGIPDLSLLKHLFYYHNPKFDFNIWLSILKTGSFDELELFFAGTTMWYISYFMMIIWGLMMLSAAILFIRWVSKSRSDRLIVCFFAGYCLLLIGYFFKFYIDYPYVCTPNLRYIVPILSLGAIGIGFYADTVPKSAWLHRLVNLWGLLVCIVYGSYFFTNGIF